MALNDSPAGRRNFGPRVDLMLLPDRVLPASTRTVIHGFYAIVGLVLARKNIAHSREYLRLVTGRPAGLVAAWRHYRSLIASLHRKLRVSAGEPLAFRIRNPESASDLDAINAARTPALFGTFHVGDSDLLGFMLAERYDRPLSMVRLRVGNSSDIDRLAARFSGKVRFIWVNRPDDTLLALKDAVLAGDSVALQCDRLEHSANAEPFRFLGARRLFPFSIYRLALIFNRPVLFAFSMPGADGEPGVIVTDAFRPDSSASREDNLATARRHFQRVLDTLETELRANPTQWFNFTPMNTAVSETL
jgi:predicted LPLAT superfamily acyltransferase